MRRIFYPILFVFLLFLNSCYVNSLTGKRGLVLISDDVMGNLGEQTYQEVITQASISTNLRHKNIVNRVSRRIADASGENFAWEFNLVENPEANAFCLPGGKIVVNTGILKPAQNEAALAFIIGHEVGHAVGRHGAQRISQGLLAEGGLLALDSYAFKNNPNRDEILAGIGLGTQVGILLPYSRSHESESDYMGLIYMARSGYDPKEAPKFWQRMEASMAGQKPPEFLSTHPSDIRRTKQLDQKMNEALAIYSKTKEKHGIGEKLP